MTAVADFRRRADREARRYGGDSWVFVRELLQNARDAGARSVTITVEQDASRQRIRVRDDGCGMTFEHARRFLFTLYATSKSDQRDRAGRFGIGFWSVLRFEPDEIMVRSNTGRGDGWQLRMSGDLDRTERSPVAMRRGTEVELTRAARNDDIESRVWHAVRRDARSLRRLGRRGVLEVWVNRRLATAEIELPAPSLAFRGRGLRGAAALSDAPRVDLLAHGLRVRTAATLDELITEPERPGKTTPAHVAGLLPRVILDSRRLQVLMARGDARSDAELSRAVELGRRAVRRLVRGQLDRVAGRGPVERAAGRFAEVVLGHAAWRLGLLSVLIVAAVAGGAWLAAGAGSGRASSSTDPGPGEKGAANSSAAVLEASVAGRYTGPTVDLLRGPLDAVDLTYRPTASAPLLTVFRAGGIEADGRIAPSPAAPMTGIADSAPCTVGCLDVSLILDGAVGSVRLPVATGHRLDPASLSPAGADVRLDRAPDGVPLVVFDRPFSGPIRYRSAPATEVDVGPGGSWPELPAETAEILARLRRLDAGRAATLGERWVGQRVAYDTSEAAVRQHREAHRDGVGFVDRCLSVGAGDCDVLNALLATLLHRAGFEVRLAVGLVGSDGRARPGLHAWVELQDEDGSWRTADASRWPPRSVRPAPNVASQVAGLQPSGGWSPTGGIVSGRTLWLAATVALIAAAAAVGLRRRLVVDDVRWSDETDLERLLRGALERPEAFSGVPALFSRPVVPLLGGGGIDLDRARKLAARGRLAFSCGPSSLALEAVRRRRPVLDGRRGEGSAVATALGAVDLDRWQRLLDEGRPHPVTERLAAALERAGDHCRVLTAPGVPNGVAVLGAWLLGPDRGRVIVVDDAGDLWRRVRELEADRPRTAVFVLAEATVHGLSVLQSRRRRLLRRLAADCLVERGERDP